MADLANKLRPLHDRVVLEPLSSEAESASGIIIPETVKEEKSDKGRVVAVGPGKRGDDKELVPMSLKVGDKVLFSKYSADEVELEGKKYLVVPESAVMAVISE